MAWVTTICCSRTAIVEQASPWKDTGPRCRERCNCSARDRGCASKRIHTCRKKCKAGVAARIGCVLFESLINEQLLRISEERLHLHPHSPRRVCQCSLFLTRLILPAMLRRMPSPATAVPNQDNESKKQTSVSAHGVSVACRPVGAPLKLGGERGDVSATYVGS